MRKNDCSTETWTLQEIADALNQLQKNEKKIKVPMFQRGKRWSIKQELNFIDSIKKGYPVGTMLFYKTILDNKENYLLVDGLQRGNCIRKYISSPTDYFDFSSISDELCANILNIFKVEKTEENYLYIKKEILDFIKEKKDFKNIQFFEPSKNIAKKFCEKEFIDYIDQVISELSSYMADKQSLHENICSTEIPIVVYSGDIGELHEIFARINSQGTPLDQYEVYAAAWPIDQKVKISNENIINYVIKKYESFISDGFSIHGYNRTELMNNKTVNAFEYLFGLSKFLVNKYEILSFNKSVSDDVVNSLGFELVNACFNDCDKIKDLYKNIYAITDIDLFEKALYKAIDFVSESIAPITCFKGNRRKEQSRVFHAKYLALSMISYVFKEMYSGNDFSKESSTWKKAKTVLEKNLRAYYVYDILTNFWSEGGTKKIYSVSNQKRYHQPISPNTWEVALDSYFEKSLERKETKQVTNPKSEEYAFLNCIYMKRFSAKDQLSSDKFDIEHIATKEQMKQFISKTNGEGLPISSIANLCYLPEYDNRSKKKYNFYQDKKYREKVNLEEVEEKYSFTKESDLEWMDMPFVTKDDYPVLADKYINFCRSRFSKLKIHFCESLNIDRSKISISNEKDNIFEEKETKITRYKTLEDCVAQISQKMNCGFTQIAKRFYESDDKKIRFFICFSKKYIQGKKEKYWFAYRKYKELSVTEQNKQFYIAYWCKEADEIILLPIKYIEDNLNRLNYSENDDGEITHWHIVLFKNTNNDMTILFSHPNIEEISINDYRI